MLAKKREEIIIERLNNNGTVTISELVDILGVTPPTIRNDIKKIMTDNPNYKRIHGGVIYNRNDNGLVSMFSDRKKKNLESKTEIAKLAIELIKEKETLFLDSSSTVHELAKLLIQSPLYNTVITNGLVTASLLKKNPNLTVLVTGGEVQADSNTIADTSTIEYIGNYNIDKYFFSTSGVSVNYGLTEYNIREIDLKKALLKKSQTIIGLIDSSKFNRVSNSTFATINNIDYLITDSEISDETLLSFSKFTNIIVNRKL